MLKKVVLLGLLGLMVECKQPQLKENKPVKEKHPNVVLIYTDDVGFGDLQPYGGKVPTPNLAKLAKEGVQHFNAYAAAATCTPSRYSLLTGEYAWRQKGRGIAPGDAAALIPAGKQTVASIFQKAGYKTAVIGKWHLGLGTPGALDWNKKITNSPNDIGFDYSYIIPATADRVPCVYVENGKVVNLDPNDPITVSYKQKVGNWPTGKENPELLKLKSSPGQGHNNTIINGIGRIGFQTGGKAALWKDEEIADDLTQKAKKFMAENKDTPFFMYLATNNIHVPRMPNERFQGKSGKGLRGDAILELDYLVGEVMKSLEELKIAENTIIIFSSDNGPVLDDGYMDQAVEKKGDHNPSGMLRGGKYSVYEAGTRIPLIVYWKNKITPKQSYALVSQVDFLGSMAQFLGQNYDKNSAMDSQNQWKAWEGKTKKGRNYIVQEAFNSTLSITDGTYKYIEPLTVKQPSWLKLTGIDVGFNAKPQLYDLASDPAEKENIADKNPAVLEKMKSILQRIIG